jgi:hypothetical protein
VKQKDIVDVCVVAIAKQRSLQNFTHTNSLIKTQKKKWTRKKKDKKIINCK